MGELALQDLHQAVVDAIRTLARASGVKTYVFVVAGNGHVFKSVSPDLKAHERGLVDEIEKATANPIVVWEEETPSNLKRAEQALAKTKHAELHPIVAVMIDSLNKLNNHKVSRSTALKDSSSTPKWWPHNPKKYAERTQQLNIKDLTLVIDAVFAEVRGNAPRIEKLRSMLASHFKSGACSIGTRAVFDAYFDFLLDEARRSETGVSVSSANLADASRDSESLGVLQESPRLSVCESRVSGLPALQVKPASNVHRPLPILQPVPEFTKQELCAPSTKEETKGLDVGPLPARRKFAEAADLPRFSSKEKPGSAIWSAPSILTTQEYVELDERRKRARTDALSPGSDWSSYSAPLAAPIVPGFYNSSPCIGGASDSGFHKPSPCIVGGTDESAHESKWSKYVGNGAVQSVPGVADWPSTVKTESGSAPVEQRADRVTQALEQLAEAERAQGCMWMLFGGSGTELNGKRMWCSSSLTPMTEALVEGLEVAISSQLQDAPVDNKMAYASDVLGDLVRSPSPSESTSPSVVLSEGPSKLQTDLAFVVEALVKGMNRVASSQGSSAQSTIPDWFPYPTKYWTYTEELGKGELLHVLDIVFRKIRGEYFHIRELKAQWDTSKVELCNIELRRAVDTYLDALEMEARTLLQVPHRGAI